MKFLAAALSLALAVSASPVPQTEAPDTVYSLQLRCENHKELDKMYLSINGDSVGVYPGKDSFEFTFRGSAEKSQMDLYPTGIVAHSIALVGQEGKTLMDLHDVAITPGGTTFPVGVVADWANFVRTETPSADGTMSHIVGSVKYSGQGKWKAIPAPEGNGSWKISWDNGSGPTVSNYQEVEVVYGPSMHIW